MSEGLVADGSSGPPQGHPGGNNAGGPVPVGPWVTLPAGQLSPQEGGSPASQGVVGRWPELGTPLGTSGGGGGHQPWGHLTTTVTSFKDMSPPWPPALQTPYPRHQVQGCVATSSDTSPWPPALGTPHHRHQLQGHVAPMGTSSGDISPQMPSPRWVSPPVPLPISHSLGPPPQSPELGFWGHPAGVEDPASTLGSSKEAAGTGWGGNLSPPPPGRQQGHPQ